MPGRAEKKAANKAAHVNKGRRNAGSGAGIGGAAKGAWAGGAGPGRPAGVKTGEGKKARAQAALLEAAPEAVRHIIEVMQTEGDPRSLTAALSILNRVGLHEKAAVEHSADANNPPVFRIEIVDEPDNASHGGSPPA
jgi:hypothetical protein